MALRMRMSCRALAATVGFLLLNLTPLPAAGQEPDSSSYPDRYSLSVGGFLVDYVSTEMRVNAVGFPLGTTIDLSKDLDLQGQSRVVRVEGYARLGYHHRIDASWFYVSRQGSRTLDKEIQFKGEIFEFGAVVESKTTTNLVKVSYTYSFYRVARAEIGVQLGLHLMNMSLSVNATQIDREQSGGGLLPLPNLGLIISYQMSPRFDFKYQSQIFFIEIGDYGGSLTDLWVAMEYRLWRNVGVGLGYNRFVLEATAETDEFNGDANITFNGLSLYVVGKF